LRDRWLPTLALALLALPTVAAGDGLVVTRRVAGDELVAPSPLGASGGCPESLAAPVPGDSVRLSVDGANARRDEPALSVIVRLDDGVAFVLHHASHTFSRLHWPPRSKQIESEFRGRMGASAEEVYPYRAEGEVRRTSGSVAGRQVAVRSLTVESMLLGRLDVEVAVEPTPALGRAAFAAESLAQAIRHEGEAWIDRLGPTDGVPLRLAYTAHLPAALAQHREEATAVERSELDPATFQPPEGYEKVKHKPVCF